ncbi:MAG: transposase [Nitrospirae bacterium]|nr:transposase [Nitrospirota bacterium]
MDELPNFPEECSYVIDILGKVYHNDDIAKKENMTPEQRLAFHQEHSGPRMEVLYAWLNLQIEEKKVEPNSGLGKAFSYMLKRWERLTLFLLVAGAPLDNNLCEQILKRAILHRKNALFYKTQHGADIGDMFMRLIHTCYLNGVNAFDYLTELQKHVADLCKNPGLWMPWNFRETIAALQK